MVWADDERLINDAPSTFDQRLVNVGIVDQNYKIINQSKLNEILKEYSKRYSFPEKKSDGSGISITWIEFNNFKIEFFLPKEIKKEYSDVMIEYLKKTMLPKYCEIFNENIVTKKNIITMNMILRESNGSLIEEISKKNTECDWDQYNYLDFTSSSKIKKKLLMPLKYRVAPEIPSFHPYELGWETRTLEIELLVNESGDVIKVGYPSIYFSDDSDKLYQKLKPTFLNAKFYPYIVDGKPRAFLTQQSVRLESSESEPLFHKIIKSIRRKQ
ncbi:hypothetical protein MXM33_09445 [Acinetobacter vivianii]|uniref:hypothetical protein n=1 Tax=Acinetobacter vivianii TaxID=1776742 RepID=UPI002DBAF1A5|nr:hypothetical protein [Acinetobacter vivianii]MEB6667254.1 hypothetical protein [Acinetobacter vivianii]